MGREGRDDIKNLCWGDFLKKLRWLPKFEFGSSGCEASDVAIVRHLSKAMAPAGLPQRRSPNSYEMKGRIQNT